MSEEGVYWRSYFVQEDLQLRFELLLEEQVEERDEEYEYPEMIAKALS